MSADALIGKQLGEYRLEELLAQGGMARVYRAMDARLNRLVVVKVIDPSFHKNPEYIMRFEREAQAIARLDHPNIVRLYRFDEQDEWLYMAMQHIQGADLGTVLSRYRADGEYINPDGALRIISEVCLALDYAHQKGVIHRDIKPANILLDMQGTAYITDFGLALVTEVGTRGEIFGSPHYIAPEQAISSAKAVPQSDLYAVGVILFEMFTGEVPFDASEPLDIALMHMSEQPPAPRQIRPEINPELELVILKSLAKKPEDRYPNGAALVEALERSMKARSAVSLLEKRSTIPHQTIPQLIALNVNKEPPAATDVNSPEVHPVEESIPVGTETSSGDKRPWKLSGAVIGLGLLLSAIACALVFGLPLINRSGNTGAFSPNPNMTATPAFTFTLTESSVTLPSTPPVVALAQTLTVVSATQLPTQTALKYELLFVTDKDSTIMINQSMVAFPLELLMFVGDKNKHINGTDWGVTNLNSGACVGAWKEGGRNAKYELPNGLDCQLVGDQIVLKKGDWFGDKEFDVLYDDKSFGTCEKNADRCLITIFP